MTESVSVRAFRGVIHDLLRTGSPTIERAARRSGIPVRTLQRRLHDSGITYEDAENNLKLIMKDGKIHKNTL